MAVYSIICEYNPFHNGHKYQIDSLKPNTIVCLMSSDFVQRGTFAICDKYSRARAALECGADLVLELPFPYSMLSAEYFASAGIDILTRLGFTDCLSFGSECDDVNALRKIAEYLVSDKYENDIKSILLAEPFLAFAVAREKAVVLRLGERAAKILKHPNNILGVEYIKAILKQKSRIVPQPLLRCFSAHHDTMPTDSFASAGTVRNMIQGGEDISQIVPPAAYEIYKKLISDGKMPADIKKLENGILAFLRMTPVETLRKYYDCSSVADIMKNAAASAVSLEELYEKCSTKNFTHARIRRCITAAYLGIDKETASSRPLYTSVLALNKKGAQLLSQVRKNCDIAVLTKPAHIKKYDGTAVYRQYMAGVIAQDIFALTLPKAGYAGESLRRTPVVLEL